MTRKRKAKPAIRTVGFLLTALLSWIGLVVPLQAQVDQGTITGIVTDGSGAALNGATVTIANLDTGQRLSATTNTSGVYIFPLLKVGRYDVTASATNFSPSVVNGVAV